MISLLKRVNPPEGHIFGCSPNVLSGAALYRKVTYLSASVVWTGNFCSTYSSPRITHKHKKSLILLVCYIRSRRSVLYTLQYMLHVPYFRVPWGDTVDTCHTAVSLQCQKQGRKAFGKTGQGTWISYVYIPFSLCRSSTGRR